MINAQTKIILHRNSGELELHWGEDQFTLSAEFLRVHSPSAEVQGHGPGQKKLPLDKHSVKISGIEAQGNYAVKLIFDDGHDSGIYTWQYLSELSQNQDELWQRYQKEAEDEKLKRDDIQPIKWQ